MQSFIRIALVCSLLFYPVKAGFYFQGQAASNITTGFPGQSGNLVGFAATPTSAPVAFTNASGQTWPGAYSSLTAWPGGTGSQTISSGTNAQSGAGTSGNPYVFAFYDFAAGSGTTTISVSNAIFVGCRFQSNSSTSGANVIVSGSNVTLIYSSMVPIVSLQPSPPNGAWPSAGAGLGIIQSSGTYSSYATPSADSYQYGVQINTTGAAVTIDHSDIWGFDNAITFPSSGTGPYVVSNNWIHDARNQVQSGGHTDGPGFLNGSIGGNPNPTNITISGNTIASIGNTNAIAMQGSLSNNNFLCNVTGNYLSGFGDTIFMGASTFGIPQNSNFQNNVFGTDINWQTSLMHGNYGTTYTVSGNNNLWRNNTFKVISGTSQTTGSTPNWTSSNNGNFVLPNLTLSTSDWSN